MNKPTKFDVATSIAAKDEHPLVATGYLDDEHPTNGGPAKLPNGNPEGVRSGLTEGEKLADIVEDIKEAVSRLEWAIGVSGRVV